MEGLLIQSSLYLVLESFFKLEDSIVESTELLLCPLFASILFLLLPSHVNNFHGLALDRESEVFLGFWLLFICWLYSALLKE